MDMIGHQRLGMKGAATSASRLFQPMEITVVILIGEKARLAINAALHDMQRVIGEKHTRAAGHGQHFRKLNVSDPFGLRASGVA